MGDRSDSNVYIRNKLKKAEEVGIHAVHLNLPQDTTQEQLENVSHSFFQNKVIASKSGYP